LFDRAILTTLANYRDEAGAHAGFAALIAGYDANGFVAGRTAPAVGSEATALRATKTESGGRTFKGLALVFRVGTVVVDLHVRDYTDDAPALSATLPLAAAVAQRVAEAASGRAPNLSLGVP